MNVLRTGARRDVFLPPPRQRFSSGAVQKAEREASQTSSNKGALLQGSNTEGLGEVVRHGRGDAFITLNVGGKDFHTLRSTVNSNPVLADHVARAEANREITKNGAVFIDRDPEHFNFILKHLRNRMEQLSTHGAPGPSKNLTRWTKANIELPKDDRVLRELYVEATFYRIEELQHVLCTRSWLTSVISFFNKNANPFDAAARLAAQLRAGLIALGSLGTVGGTVLVTNMEEEFDSVLQKLGLRRKKKGDGPPSSSAAGA